MLVKYLDKIWNYNPYLGAIATASICGALFGIAFGLIYGLIKILL